MRTSIIAPIPLLDRLIGQRTYHLCLAHLVLESPEYREFYRRAAQKGFVILDNSAHELGTSLELHQLAHAIELVQPQEVVLPDRLFFGEDTVEQSREALRVLKQNFPTVSFMGVPQGRTFDEFFQCTDSLMSLKVQTLGISKDFEVWPGGLSYLISRIYQSGTRRVDFHLLGWGRQLSQLVALEASWGHKIRGIDSARPVSYAARGIKIPLDPKEAGRVLPLLGRPKDFFQLQDIDLDLADHNIRVFQTWARDDV